jgi:hypothetical protein
MYVVDWPHPSFTAMKGQQDIHFEIMLHTVFDSVEKTGVLEGCASVSLQAKIGNKMGESSYHVMMIILYVVC